MRLLDPKLGGWDAVRQAFRWNVPEYFNIAAMVCDRQADDPAKVALYYEDEAGLQHCRCVIGSARNEVAYLI